MNKLPIKFATLLLSAISMGACSNATTIEMQRYEFDVETKAGVKVEDVEIKLLDNGKVVKTLVTDQDGYTGVKIAKKNYTLQYGGVAKSWKADKTSIEKSESEVKIVFETAIIDDVKPEKKTYTVGDVIYDFEMCEVDVNGNATRKKASEYLKGHDVLVINLWATWCSPCRAEMPFMDEAYKEMKDDVALLAISTETTDTIAKVSKFKADNDLSFPIGPDETYQDDNLSKTSVTYGFYPKYIPTTAIVDRYGTIKKTIVGSMTSKEAFTEEWKYYIGPNYDPSKI